MPDTDSFKEEKLILAHRFRASSPQLDDSKAEQYGRRAWPRRDSSWHGSGSTQR